MAISSVSGSNYSLSASKNKKSNKNNLKIFLGISAMSAIYLASKISGKDANIDTSKALNTLGDSFNSSKISLFLDGIKSSVLNSVLENISALREKFSSCFVNFTGILNKSSEYNLETKKSVHQG